jgi:hypothetical protein
VIKSNDLRAATVLCDGRIIWSYLIERWLFFVEVSLIQQRYIDVGRDTGRCDCRYWAEKEGVVIEISHSQSSQYFQIITFHPRLNFLVQIVLPAVDYFHQFHLK